MNKTIAVVIVVVAVLCIGVPPVIGALTERSLRMHADALETLPGSPYTVDVVQYDGGWFGSSARLEANLTDDYLQQLFAVASADDDPNAAVASLMMQSLLSQSLPLSVQIAHGPVLTDNGLRLGIAGTVIRPDPETAGMNELLESLGIPYLFEARTVTSVSGDTSFIADVPQIEIGSPLGQLQFSGIDVEGDFDLSEFAVAAVGDMEFLRVDAGFQGSLNLERFTFATDVQRYGSRLWFGDVDATLGAINIQAYGAGGPLSIVMTEAGVAFDSETDDDNQLVTLEGSYYLESLTSQGLAEVGQQLALTDARLDLAIRDFSLEALAAYYEYSQLVAADPRSAPPLIPGVQDMLYLTLSTSPEIVIGPADLVWNGDPFVANVTINIDGSNLAQRDQFNMLDIRAIVDAISVAAYTDLSEAMATEIAEQVAQNQIRSNATANGAIIAEAELQVLAANQAIVTLLGLVSQGLLVSTDDGYHSELDFSGGRLFVNGNEIPLGLPL